MDVFNLIKTLSSTPGPSGLEQDIATVIAELWTPYVDEMTTDAMGNLIATRYGSGEAPRKRVMVTAHMDEIGLMVTDIVNHNGYGFLRVHKVGGTDARQLFGHRVTVHGKRNLPGVIGSLPGSMLPEEHQGKVYGFESVVVDTGLSAETLPTLVSIGDFITFRQPVTKLMNKRVSGKALDNRASVAAVTVALDHLSKRNHEWDILAVATVQEEVGVRGATTSGFSLNPDLALVLDLTFAKQPGVSGIDVSLGGGPVLDIGVNVHPAIFKGLKDSAESLELKTMTVPHARGSGTDARAIQVVQAGVPVGLLGFASRYMHSVVEVVSLKDLKRTGRLVSAFVANLDDTFLSKLEEELVSV